MKFMDIMVIFIFIYVNIVYVDKYRRVYEGDRCTCIICLYGYIYS